MAQRPQRQIPVLPRTGYHRAMVCGQHVMGENPVLSVGHEDDIPFSADLELSAHHARRAAGPRQFTV